MHGYLVIIFEYPVRETETKAYGTLHIFAGTGRIVMQLRMEQGGYEGINARTLSL